MHRCDFDRQIALIARRQHGAFSTDQARDAGGTRHVLANRRAHGTLIRLAANVWALASHPPTWQRQLKAAELSVAGSAVCDRGAAVVHGLAGYRLGRLVVGVAPTGNPRSSLAEVRRVRDLPTTEVDGIRVTTVAQTLFDLLASSELAVLEAALDDAILRGMVSGEELAERSDALSAARRPGIAAWRALVEERSASAWVPAESVLESELRALVKRLPSGVPVSFQATPPFWRSGAGRVDAYLPLHQVILEADGRRWHARMADFDRDRWRDNVAAAHGHRVVRFTHTHLTQFRVEALRLLLAAVSVDDLRIAS